MRLLVTGAGGQVGRELIELAEGRGDTVVALDHRQLDICDRDAVHRALGEHRPEVVVHTAAWTAVDACEADPQHAHAVNASGSRFVAEACASTGSHLVHLSTDYVFDGTKATPYEETDEPNPICVYGESKLGGEIAVAEALGGTATIARTSWVCGRYGANMVKTMLRLANGEGVLRFVDDQVGHPTVVADLVVALHRLSVERLPGVFHVTNQGAVSWFELAREVLHAAGADPERVVPITTAELDPPRPARRPANSVLKNSALEAAGLPLLPHHKGSIVALVTALREG